MPRWPHKPILPGSIPGPAILGCSSVWPERCVRDAEAAGSSPVIPTFLGRSSAWSERCIRVAEVAGSNPVTPIEA